MMPILFTRKLRAVDEERRPEDGCQRCPLRSWLQSVPSLRTLSTRDQVLNLLPDLRPLPHRSLIHRQSAVAKNSVTQARADRHTLREPLESLLDNHTRRDGIPSLCNCFANHGPHERPPPNQIFPQG